MNLTTFSTEQLNLFVHTLEGIVRQLDDISSSHLGDVDKERRETMMQQAYVLEEQLTLEIAHRSLVILQAQLGYEQITLETAHRSLVCLQIQLGGDEQAEEQL